MNRKEYIQNLRGELESLGISPKRTNELNDSQELEALTENVKETYYQDYKTAYSYRDIDASNFDHLV
ncbi:MAG: hypothetical protein ABI361_08725 [Nitrososphaera sp.]|jgi:hypothetical protein